MARFFLLLLVILTVGLLAFEIVRWRRRRKERQRWRERIAQRETDGELPPPGENTG